MTIHKIGFIGGGNMGSSLISGLCASGHPSSQIWVSDINKDTLDALAEFHEVNTSSDNQAIVEEVDVIVLAVKPQMIEEVAKALAADIQKKQILVLSIAAGITQQNLANCLGSDVAIVRCMPNTPAMVLTGTTVMNANANVTLENRDLAERIMRSVGVALWVDKESDLDAVTAISGSGPAYYFLMMEAMEKVAIEFGLDPIVARLIVQQTALGAAKIALESLHSPEQLRLQVTSPGGTTEQALNVLNEGEFGALVAKAIHAARDRSIELSAL
jgi:pyrroline-5-carboxylate reductase